MRTKALLSVAAIAASAVTAMAQSNVYSLNIVGYAQVNIAPGYNLLANPLSTGTNGANEIMPILDGELILTWNGKGFNQTGYDSGFGGWVGADGTTASVPPSLPPGTGFFFFNPVAATNVTFVGQVVPNPGSTSSLTLNPGYNLVGSVIPANVNQITNAPVSLPVLDGMLILSWSNGAYHQTGFDSGFGGWVQADGTTATTAPPYTIGEGFFFFQPLGQAQTWSQSLP